MRILSSCTRVCHVFLNTNPNTFIPKTGFEVQEDASNKTFFSEIIASISDAQFSPDGRYIVARDYMTLKIWDIKMENKPVKVLHIHEMLRSKLCDLYENDCIFDKFECCFSGCGKYVYTQIREQFFNIF